MFSQLFKDIMVEDFVTKIDEQMDRVRLVARIFKALSREEQNILRLYYYDDYTQIQIANEYHVSEARIGQRIKECLQVLRCLVALANRDIL